MDSAQLARYRKKISEFSSTSDVDWWKPSPGRNKIRIIPGFGEGVDFFKEYWQSFNAGPSKRALIGRKQYGDNNCPLEKYMDELRSRGDEISKKELEMMSPKRQVALFIIDRSSPEKGPRCWSATPTTVSKIIQICVDPDYGDITTVMPDQDNKGARDIIINYTPKDKAPNGFAKFDIVPDASPSPLGTAEQIAEWTAIDLFEKHRIGEPQPLEWVMAVLEGREQELIDAQKSEKTGSVPQPPPNSPAPPAPFTDATVSYPPHYSSASKFWAFVDGKVVEVGFDAICAKVMDGDDPKIMNYDQSGGWKKASELGIVKVVKESAPPPPSMPAPPPMPNEAEEIEKKVEELKNQPSTQSSDAMAKLKAMLK